MSKEIMKITLDNGNFSVFFGKQLNLSLVSHALRCASLQLDNMIIAGNMPKKSALELPPGITDRLK